MKKLLTHLFIIAVLKDERKAQMIVDIIYDKNGVKGEVKKPEITKGSVKFESSTNNKRKEVSDAIQYLKNKKNKTKADREKIQMLEVILKSV